MLAFKDARTFGDGPVPRRVAAFEAQHQGVRVKTEALGAASDEQHQFFVIQPGERARTRAEFNMMMLDVSWMLESARGLAVRLTDSLHQATAGGVASGLETSPGTAAMM